MTDWTPAPPLDQPYAMTRFGAHRWLEHLMAYRTATKDGSELAPEYGYGAQSFVVKNGKCYVAGGWGPNLNPGWAGSFGTDPSLQGIFEFDGSKITKVVDFPAECPGAFGVCLDANGNFAYDDDGWANYGQVGKPGYYSGVIGTYSGPANIWSGNDCKTPRLIDGEVVFCNTYLSLNGNPRTAGAPSWSVKDTREAVIARAESWPPVLERFDASQEIDSPTLFHSLGDVRQDPQGNVWAVVLRVQDGYPTISGSDQVNPNNYAAIVKVPQGLVGECEVWWEAPADDNIIGDDGMVWEGIPWPYRGTMELEMADPDSIFCVMTRPQYFNEQRGLTANPWNPTNFQPGSSWVNQKYQCWRINKHAPNSAVSESQGLSYSLSGALLRFQDVLIADAYYGTIMVRYPDGTWHEERADAGDGTYLRPGDPAPPDTYGDTDTYSPTAPIDYSYFDWLRIGPTNGTDLYGMVYYTQAAASGYGTLPYYPRAGDWVRWKPNQTIALPTVLVATIGPSGYYF